MIRLSWIPEDVFDPQGMRWHPFGLRSRRYEDGSCMASFQTMWYWRRYWLSYNNPLHPRCLAILRREGWDAYWWWCKRIVSAGRD